MPFLGIHKHVESDNNQNAGLRLGVLLGGHLNEMISLNGEFTIDALSPKNTNGAEISAGELLLAFSPLLHVPSGNLDLVVGPKLGFWGGGATYKVGGVEVGKASAGGATIGAQVGIFAALNDGVGIGGLVGFDVRSVSRVCVTPTGGSETCSEDDEDTGSAEKVLSFSAAALF